MDKENYRLPSEVRPINYDILFEVNLKKCVFTGKETIDVELGKTTSTIILNAHDLKIEKAELIHGGKSFKAKIRMDNEKERLFLDFHKKFKGNVKLRVDFNGKMTDSLLGFYRSKYKAGNSEKYIATTQFEAPYARRAFPCFDEPQMKATFDVTMKIDKNFQAISNMPIKEEVVEGGKKLVRFHRSPRMSTYLLYMGVGEFEFLEGKFNDKLVRIVTVPDKIGQAKFALELTKNFLKYFEEYSGVKYPLPKIDMIALPDFIVGAMENWGAITFREVYLLFDSKVTSTLIKKRIAMIIAHELWHQWSGDLVTMKWWNDLWLNESFATFMAYKAVDHFFPEWKTWEDFIGDETSEAFEDDSIKSTHPIEVHVENPHQIEELFDAISYSKGGSILRMIEGYLGEDAFRKGVSNYLATYSYKNATSSDLWNSLAKASDKPVKKVTEKWITQAGYPVVESRIEHGKIHLAQRRFVFNHKDRTIWPIPLAIKTDNGVLTKLFDEPKDEIQLNNFNWFKINYGQTGFYRVKYPEENIVKLKNVISSKQLPPLDRWGLQNDMYKLSHNGKTRLDGYLDFLKSYSGEDDWLVLSSIYSSMRMIKFVFSEEDFWNRVWPNFKNYFKGAFQKILNRLGWEPKQNETQKDSLLRDLAIRYLGFAEDLNVITECKSKFERYLKDGTGIYPDIRSTVFNIVAANGDMKIFGKILKFYKNTTKPEEQRAALISLGQFKDTNILKKGLDFSLTKYVRMQDFMIVFSSVASNTTSRKILLKWFESNWKKLKVLEKSGQIFVRTLESLIDAYVRMDDGKELKGFFARHPVKYKMTLGRAFEKLERNSQWIEKNSKTLEGYFKELV